MQHLPVDDLTWPQNRELRVTQFYLATKRSGLRRSVQDSDWFQAYEAVRGRLTPLALCSFSYEIRLIASR